MLPRSEHIEINDGGTATVDELIDQGASPSSLRDYFSSRRDAVRYYAARQSAKYPLPASLDGCACCEQPGELRVLEVRWRAVLVKAYMVPFIVAASLAGGHLRMEEYVWFSTYHAVCPVCWRRTWWRRAAANVLSFAGPVGLLLGIPLVVGLVVAQFWPMARTDREWFGLWGWWGAGAVVAGIIFIRWMRRLRVPFWLERIGQRPFVSVAVKDLTAEWAVGKLR